MAKKTAPVLTVDYVEALTRRVDALEKKLLSPEGTLPVIPLTTAVRELERKLDALASREKGGQAQELWGKIGRLETLVSPDYLQSLKVTEGAKEELLCGQVEQLTTFSDRMDEVLKKFSKRRVLVLTCVCCHLRFTS